MAECPRCGALIEGEDIYCGRCGERLKVGDTSPTDTSLTQKSMDVVDIRYKLGMVYYKKGNIAQALELWKKVLAQHSEHTVVREMIEKAETEIREGGVSE
jgi:hypothetical protein